MNRKIRYSKFINACVGVLLSSTCATVAHAHFPWLASDDQGHAVMWFGESTNDRTYNMPAAVQGIQLRSEQTQQPIETKPVDNDDLVGIQSKLPINPDAEISGTVTYGLYHGTKLTYHVEHLPHADPATWPAEARPDARLQTIIRRVENGDIVVTLLHNGQPLTKTEVKLFCEAGDEEAARSTNEHGVVTFASGEVESGLNAIVVGLTDSQATGTYQDENYGSTTDYLTATFRISNSDEGKDVEQESKQPAADPNSGASVGPANLPDLPEELTSFGAAIAGNHLYVYGGHTGDAHSYSTDEQSDRFWSVDLSGGEKAEWKKLESGPSLQGLALVAYDGRLIRIGGFTAVNGVGEKHDLRSQASVASYDTALNQWTELSPLPEARSSLDAAVLGSKVYVFGGWKLDGDNDQGTWHQSAWSLDLSDASSTWQPTAEPPFQRRAISVAAHDGKLYVIGGMQSKGGPTTRVGVYDPETNTWSEGPAIPGSGMSGFGSAAFECGGQLFVSTMDGFVHRLTRSGNGWETIAKIDPARFFHRMLPVDEKKLLLIGGANMRIGKFTQIDAVSLADKH